MLRSVSQRAQRSIPKLFQFLCQQSTVTIQYFEIYCLQETSKAKTPRACDCIILNSITILVVAFITLLPGASKLQFWEVCFLGMIQDRAFELHRCSEASKRVIYITRENQKERGLLRQTTHSVASLLLLLSYATQEVHSAQ